VGRLAVAWQRVSNRGRRIRQIQRTRWIAQTRFENPRKNAPHYVRSYEFRFPNRLPPRAAWDVVERRDKIIRLSDGIGDRINPGDFDATY
jgi:hypothetical protein